MWITQRTGSSWETHLVDSHPHVTMYGEKFNTRNDAAIYDDICNFFTADKQYTGDASHRERDGQLELVRASR